MGEMVSLVAALFWLGFQGPPLIRMATLTLAASFCEVVVRYDPLQGRRAALTALRGGSQCGGGVTKRSGAINVIWFSRGMVRTSGGRTIKRRFSISTRLKFGPVNDLLEFTEILGLVLGEPSYDGRVREQRGQVALYDG
ncbi:hypothetical protein BOMU111920_01345 [Bordetella muralis]